MRTSASFPRNELNRRGGEAPRGFTLLEVLITLAIVALLAGLAMPNVVAWIGAAERATRDAQFRSSIAGLSLKAYSTGRPLLLERLPAGSAATDPAQPAVELPADWTVTFETPLRVSAVGLCSDARGEVRTADGERRFRVEAPDCRVVLDS